MTAGAIEFSPQQLRRWARRVFDTFFCSCDASIVPFGKECIWHVKPVGLHSGSVVVSAGVGGDISFEKELTDQRGCRILLLDPSPTGIATMTLPENQRTGIEYLQLALAGEDGEKRFNRPRQAAEGSFWVVPGGADSGSTQTFPCRSLSSLAAERGWNRIDLLKLDIEGSEYAVIEDIARSGLKIDQLCVEFHHFMKEIPLARTLRALHTLRGLGLRLAHKQNCDYTLLRES